METVWTDYGEVVYILFHEDYIFVVGNGSFDDPEVRRRVVNYIKQYGNKHDVINVIYASNISVQNIYTKSDNDTDDDDDW